MLSLKIKSPLALPVIGNMTLDSKYLDIHLNSPLLRMMSQVSSKGKKVLYSSHLNELTVHVMYGHLGSSRVRGILCRLIELYLLDEGVEWGTSSITSDGGNAPHSIFTALQLYTATHHHWDGAGTRAAPAPAPLAVGGNCTLQLTLCFNGKNQR